MPFGAEPAGGTRTRFRLWAPTAKNVELVIGAGSRTVRTGPGRERQVHIVIENDRNQSRYLARDATGRALQASAQWNDDLHHALHILITGECDGYYEDYAAQPLWHLGRALAYTLESGACA